MDMFGLYPESVLGSEHPDPQVRRLALLIQGYFWRDPEVGWEKGRTWERVHARLVGGKDWASQDYWVDTVRGERGWSCKCSAIARNGKGFNISRRRYIPLYSGHKYMWPLFGLDLAKKTKEDDPTLWEIPLGPEALADICLDRFENILRKTTEATGVTDLWESHLIREIGLNQFVYWQQPFKFPARDTISWSPGKEGTIHGRVDGKKVLAFHYNKGHRIFVHTEIPEEAHFFSIDPLAPKPKRLEWAYKHLEQLEVEFGLRDS